MSIKTLATHRTSTDNIIRVPRSTLQKPYPSQPWLPASRNEDDLDAIPKSRVDNTSRLAPLHRPVLLYQGKTKHTI